ncbi:MAG: hypothetical protein ACI97A_002040 [Planctomycetota bacterium]|jgi:hypothetical protein
MATFAYEPLGFLEKEIRGKEDHRVTGIIEVTESKRIPWLLEV